MTKEERVELLYTLVLTLVPNIGPVTAKKLIALCGSAQNIFNHIGRRKMAHLNGLRMNLVRELKLDSLVTKANLILETIEKNKIHAFFYNSNLYPFRLKFIPDAPLILYTKGNMDLNAPRLVSVIGTRKPSAYGLKMCKEIVSELSDYKTGIISGLAYGIDICAQRTALEHGLSTYSVMAHGHGFIYPPEHYDLANKMLHKGGLISEFNYFQKPEREHFPMRNRLIAALSDACIIIESKEVGGSMITANLAFGYNRDIFAVPGRSTDSLSKGCNKLIKTNKAMLIENGTEIARALNWTKTNSRDAQKSLFPSLNSEEQEIYQLIKEEREVQLEKITAKSSLSLGKINSTLLSLEFKGLINALPGKVYLCL